MRFNRTTYKSSLCLWKGIHVEQNSKFSSFSKDVVFWGWKANDEEVGKTVSAHICARWSSGSRCASVFVVRRAPQTACTRRCRAAAPAQRRLFPAAPAAWPCCWTTAANLQTLDGSSRRWGALKPADCACEKSWLSRNNYQIHLTAAAKIWPFNSRSSAAPAYTLI